MKDEAIYRCIHAACARGLPRRVNFCPYCGTGQHAGVDNPAHRIAAASRVQAMPPAAPQVDMAKPAPAASAAHAAPFAAAPHAGRDDNVRAAGAGAPPPARPAAVPARPPQREPVRLRWWLLALAALWAVWLVAKPSDKKIVARIDKAIALANECKAREAQSELIALQSTKATPQQLQRLQVELNEAAAACTKARQRDKAWRDASAAVDAALASSAVEKARSRLSAFTRRWGEDDETAALKKRVDAAKPREHPRADDTR